MSYLTINGVEVPVSIPAGNGRLPVIAGERTRALSGMPRSSIRASRYEWTRATTPQAKATAQAFQGLINGDGYRWAFDSHLYDGKGLGPSLSTGCTIITTAGFWRYGGGAVQVDPTRSLRYAIALPALNASTDWTLMYWRRPVDFDFSLPTTYDHYIVQGSGTKYKNGSVTTDALGVSYDGSLLKFNSFTDVYAAFIGGHAYTAGDRIAVQGGSGNWYIFSATNTATSGGEPDWDTASGSEDTISDGGVTWSNYGSCYAYYDDAVFMPYAIPTDWVAQLEAEAQARAITALPRFRMSGSIVNNIAITAEGECGETTDLPVELAGGWESDARTFSFILREV